MLKRSFGSRIDQEAATTSNKTRRVDSITVQSQTRVRLPPEAYGVGWVCAIPEEYVAAQEFLDEVHERPQPAAAHDNNDYTLGRIAGHNVVILVLGGYGLAAAASAASSMMNSFPNIRIRLMVGIGGGAPSAKHDIRLGDVVVSAPQNGHSGVFQYDFGKTIQAQRFCTTGVLDQPPMVLRQAVNGLKAEYVRNGHRLEEDATSAVRNNPRLWQCYRKPNVSSDRLYKSEVVHLNDQERSCDEVCGDDPSKLVRRDSRADGDSLIVHYGLIASANQVMKDATIRDALAAEKDVLCFEMEAAGLMNTFSCLVVRGICDYSDSHKNKTWQGYAALVAAAYAKDILRRIPSNVADGIAAPHTIEETQSLNDEQKLELMDSLQFNQIDARQMSIKKAYSKTCEWLLKAREYVMWLDDSQRDDHHGFLWIKGKPGAGKSTLMKFAYIKAREKMKRKVTIAFFFNARGDDLEKSTIGMYRSLLFQLFERLPKLRDAFDSLGLVPRNNKARQWTLESLKELLEQAVQRLGDSNVLCYIDALDECEEDQIRDMVRFFESIGELATSLKINFRVCFSSRFYPHITLRTGLDLLLDRQEGHSQDIALYLESRLEIGTRKRAQEIRIAVQEKASGIFLWVVLVVEILRKEFDHGRIHALETKLNEIPADLHTLFRDMLTRDDSNRDELLLCLQWVMFAKHPLSPEELYFAILSGVDPNSLSAWNPDEVTTDAIERFIVHSSKGLAEITKSVTPKAQFIHESVKDYLHKEDGLKDLWVSLESNFAGQSHERLKQCCVNYMAVDVVSALNIGSSPPKASTNEAAALRESVNRVFPFLKYVVHNILYHADAAEVGKVSQAKFLQEFNLSNWILLDNLLEKHVARQHTSNASLLYILAEQNMASLISIHTPKGLCFEVEKERYGAPIFAALACGHNSAVSALLQARVEAKPLLYPLWKDRFEYVGSHSRYGRGFKFSHNRNVLSYFLEYSDTLTLAFLASSGELSPGCSFNGDTPLSLAIEEDYQAFAALLLENNLVDVNRHTALGDTPLTLAIKRYRYNMVTLLLQNDKIDVNLKSSEGKTPLEQAFFYDDRAVFSQLLSKGADIKSIASSLDALLLLAVKQRRQDIVEYLLESQHPNLEEQDELGWTPLFWAANNGNENILQLLVNKGANIDARSLHGDWTPLLVAIAGKHTSVAEVLLTRGSLYAKSLPITPDIKKKTSELLAGTRKTDARALDEKGQTPLFWAAEQGYANILKLLLDMDIAHINEKDRNGNTVLLQAIRNRHDAVAQLLLATGMVDCTVTNNNGFTPLLLAIRRGMTSTVKSLLDANDSIIGTQNKSASTFLLCALHGGHESIARLLLMTGNVDTRTSDTEGQTPLSLAVCRGYREIVSLLLALDTSDAETTDDLGRSPFSLAAERGDEQIGKLLLDTGIAKVFSTDFCLRTPLQYAVASGQTAFVRLCLLANEPGLNWADNAGRTPLLVAVELAQSQMVELLLAVDGIDLETRHANNRTPLLCAVGYSSSVERREESMAIIRCLVKKGADIEARDNDGLTPLSLAAKDGLEDVVRFLLGRGAQRKAQDNNGSTPLDWALRKGRHLVTHQLSL